MIPDYRSNSLQYWDAIHERFAENTITTDDWLDIFDEIILRTQRPVLDLGCGGGNNTKYLIAKGKQVIPCDQSPKAIDIITKNFPEIKDVRCFNMLDGFPFEDRSFDVVIADLCLHYFTRTDTDLILSELRRILVPGGHLLFRVNSVNDVNHGAGQGKEIEHHLYETDSGTLKRFFDEDDISLFFRDYKIEYLNEEIMSRYKLKKKVFRGCVRK